MSLRFLANKKISAVLGIVIALAGLGAGLYLVAHPQILQKKADVTPIIFKNIQGETLPTEDGVPVTQELNVKVQLDAP